jgi:dipeptidyl aminopeptidase/acylaminoacyl peptidase
MLVSSELIPEVNAGGNHPVAQRLETFQSGRAGQQTIHVETFLPADLAPDAKLPGVIVLHGAGGTLLGKGELEQFTRALAAHGYIAFLVYYFERTGTVFTGDKDIKKFAPLWLETVQDAVDFVSTHNNVIPECLGVFGYSLGAFLGVTEASRDPRIKALAAMSGGIFTESPLKMLCFPKLLILHGSDDRRVPATQAKSLQHVAESFGVTPEIKIYQGEGHRFTRVTALDAIQRILNFFDCHLKRTHAHRSQCEQ